MLGSLVIPLQGLNQGVAKHEAADRSGCDFQQNLRLHSFNVRMRSVHGKTFAWKPRQIHVTADRLCCGRKGSEILIDEIALDLVGKISRGAAGEEGFVRRAIRSVTQALSLSSPVSELSLGNTTPQHAESWQAATPFPSSRPRHGKLSASPSMKRQIEELATLDESEHVNDTTICIETVKIGQVYSRNIQIRAETPEEAKDIVQKLRKAVDNAMITKMGDSPISRYQWRVKIFYESNVMQTLVAGESPFPAGRLRAAFTARVRWPPAHASRLAAGLQGAVALKPRMKICLVHAIVWLYRSW